MIQVNRSFFRTFHVTPEETANCRIFEIGNGQWDIPKLRELLEKILPLNTVITDFGVEHDFPEIGHRVMQLNARRVVHTEGCTDRILLAIEDIPRGQRMSESGNVCWKRHNVMPARLKKDGRFSIR